MARLGGTGPALPLAELWHLLHWRSVDAPALRVESGWGPPGTPPGAGDCPRPGEIPRATSSQVCWPWGWGDRDTVMGGRVCAQQRAGGSSGSQPLLVSPLQASAPASARRWTLPWGPAPPTPLAAPQHRVTTGRSWTRSLPACPLLSSKHGSGSCCRRRYSHPGSLAGGGAWGGLSPMSLWPRGLHASSRSGTRYVTPCPLSPAQEEGRGHGGSARSRG